PLKSTVQISLGALAFRPVYKRPASLRRRRRRGSTNPARCKIRLKLLSLGALPDRARSYSARIFRGPQVRWAFLSRMISHTTDSSNPPGLLAGRRDNSSIPCSPYSQNRSFHLYPVLGLIPYSWHKSRKLSVFIARNTNSTRWFIR